MTNQSDKLIGMTKPMNEEDIRSARVGQWILTHWIDAKPIWQIVSKKAEKKNRWIELFDPKTGCREGVNFDQISKIGDMIQFPKK